MTLNKTHFSDEQLAYMKDMAVRQTQEFKENIKELESMEPKNGKERHSIWAAIHFYRMNIRFLNGIVKNAG